MRLAPTWISQYETATGFPKMRTPTWILEYQAATGFREVCRALVTSSHGLYVAATFLIRGSEVH